MTTKRIALLFAGQGAQQVGMGKDLVEKYPAARQIFERGDAILGRPEWRRIQRSGGWPIPDHAHDRRRFELEGNPSPKYALCPSR